MSRLYHSYSGQLRSMLVSSTDLFVFVEGTQGDPFFYAGICRSIPNLKIRYEIYMARKLPESSGGKQALLRFFSFLRERKMLVSSWKGKKTTCIFFLDKDLDDLQKKKKRSLHVVYTQHYDICNYIFMHGNLLIGAASAASVDPGMLTAELNDAKSWCLRIARLWQEWISFCLRVVEDGIQCQANYGMPSQVQERLCGCTDKNKLATLTHGVAHRCGLPVKEFQERLATTSKKVDKCFSRGHHHRIFKGKWFAVALADEIDRIMAGQMYANKNLASRLTSSIATTLDFTEPWADHFKNPILNIIAKL